ncbi:MAG: SDR family oxidoreductase [Psychroflexus sp.]|nr:SDR family oxidoreductase [Psychroflexus sp.]MDN6309421.1 SDR family oxidoreductase [Psychroflexus sp.]
MFKQRNTMTKNIIIIGAGSGLSKSVAEKFGQEGFKVGLISRTTDKLAKIVADLENQDIKSFYTTADAGNETQLNQAIKTLRNTMGSVNTLLYNAAVLKQKNIMEETTASLSEDFKVGVLSALDAVQTVFEDLKENQGTVLLTGGGLAIHPNPEMGSVCMGKAALRNLGFQLNTTLEKDNIYAGMLTICDQIKEDSTTHSPKILADKFWQLHENRSEAEIQQ